MTFKEIVDIGYHALLFGAGFYVLDEARKIYFPKDKEPADEGQSFKELDRLQNDLVGKTLELEVEGNEIKEILKDNKVNYNPFKAMFKSVEDFWKAGTAKR